MIRETGTFTPEEGIRKLTGQVAERFGILNRGVVRKGAFADLIIFDPQTFADRGTTFEPSQVAENMHHVIVNGVITVREGNLTGDRGGAILRK